MSVCKKLFSKELSKFVLTLFLFGLLTGEIASIQRNESKNLVFASLVIPYQNEVESLIWVRSIREFGGKYSSSPIWIFIPNKIERLSESRRKELLEYGVEFFPFPIDENAARFPLAAKPFAAAEAERVALGKCDFLVWIDPDHMILNQPDEFILPAGINLGYRPVHHINIGSVFSEPLNNFWAQIYKDCNIPGERIFPMRSNVEDVDIRPYFNAGHLVVRPERGILKLWLDNFKKLYSQSAYQELYKKFPFYRIFIHQAILSATVLAEMTKDEIIALSVKYNYPLNLYFSIPVEKRIKKLNKLVAPRYDLFNRPQHWNALIEIDEPIESWIDEQFKLKGVNVLVLLDDKFGANNYLNRDLFEQYGWNITITGLCDSIPGCNFFSEPYKIAPFVPDIKFDEIANIDYYDAIAIMPATSYFQPDPFSNLMKNEKAMSLIKEAVAKNVPVSTICSGTRVLAAADVIKGKKVLGQKPFKEEYEQAGAIYLGKDAPPQIEGSIMTGSRDQYYSYFVSMALATMIEERGSTGKHLTTLPDNFIFSLDTKIAGDNTAWQKLIGGFGADGARSVAQTNDGGFIITGYTFSQATGDADILVVKTDPLGNLEWAKTFGAAGTEYGNACTILKDGYLITGYTTSFGAGSKDVYVIKLDEDGNEIWSKTYGGESWDVGMSACLTENGYMICGFTNSFGAGEEDVYVIKLDYDGNEIWSKAYGGNRFEFGNSISQVANGNFVIGAATGTFGHGNSDMYLIEIDSDGNELWTKSIGGELNSILPESGRTSYDWCSQMKVCSDGGNVLVGYTNAKDIMDVFVVKTDDKGNILWGQNLGNSKFYDYGYSITENALGQYIVCGTSKSTDDNNDIFVATLDNAGNLISKNIYGKQGSEFGESVIVTSDGGVVVAGQSNSNGFGGFDVVLLKIK